MNCRLIVNDKGGRVTSYEIKKEIFTIGRSADADFTITDDSKVISKEHAKIEKYGNDWFVTDMSTNGTRIYTYNTNKLLRYGEKQMVNGKVGIGEYEIELEDGNIDSAKEEQAIKFEKKLINIIELLISESDMEANELNNLMNYNNDKENILNFVIAHCESITNIANLFTNEKYKYIWDDILITTGLEVNSNHTLRSVVWDKIIKNYSSDLIKYIKLLSLK